MKWIRQFRQAIPVKPSHSDPRPPTPDRFARRALTCLLALALVAPAASAKRLYKYRDENGVLHYTDRKPDSDEGVESWLVKVEEQQIVTLRRQRRGDKTRVVAFNHWHGPVEVGLQMPKANNVTSQPELPTSVVIDGYGESPILEIEPQQRQGRWGYELSFLAVPGDPSARPDDTLYRPPFQLGKRFYVGQAFGGMASHSEEQAYHAVDITMPEGTPVLAARDGIVMNVQEDFFGTGLDAKKYGTRANNVRVVHEDGTMAVYAHLQVESVAVKAGQTVTAGELLGLSGNTGYSSGPHLHFVVQRNVGLKLKSVPFKFDNGSPGGWRPEPGVYLEHGRTRR